MLTAIQIVTIIQGLFLGFTLLKRRQEYKKPVFWIFMGCVVSLILFSIGDDNYNLLVPNSNWFPFQETLIISFFFLFVRYIHSERDDFDKMDLIFFIPYLLSLVLQILLFTDYFENRVVLRICSALIEFAFVGMLLYCIYDILKRKKEQWLLAFMIPFTLIFTLDQFSFLFSNSMSSFLSLDSYGTFLMAIFLFYLVLYKLIVSPRDILPKSPNNKYKSSNLSSTEIASIQKELNRLMKEEQLFKDQKLNADQLAKRIGVTRQNLSEVLNVHMGMRLPDFLNQYRVEEFIKCLHVDSYKNFTLLGIATEVGFSSKSSFNSTFKKIKGMTPSEYKKRTNII